MQNVINRYFINDSISEELIASEIATLSKDKTTGAFTIFCGQVRADIKDAKLVSGIEYTAYNSMAEKLINELVEETIQASPLNSIRIIHSLGLIKAGEISLLIIVSSIHRKACLEAQQKVIESLKFDIPIWKKEIYEDGSFNWI